MKNFIKRMFCILTLVTSFSVVADEISGERIAELLGSSKTAPCLAELHKLEVNSEINASSYDFSTEFDKATKTLTTTIAYHALQQGNSVGSIVGEARIKVFAKMIEIDSHTGAYNGHPQVTSCEFKFIKL